LEQADLGLEGGEIFVGLGFGWEFGEFGALGGDLNNQVVDFGLALLLELAEFGFGFVAILFVGAEFFVEDD
jgi:hypothetical protein